MTDHPTTPEGFEQLMLRLWARHIDDLCRRAGHHRPPGVTTILGDYTPLRRFDDSCAFDSWCLHHGLECTVIDGQTGEFDSFRHPEDCPPDRYPQWGPGWTSPRGR